MQVSSRRPEKIWEALHSEIASLVPHNRLLPPVPVDITKPSTIKEASKDASVFGRNNARRFERSRALWRTAHKPIIMRSHNLLCTVFILLKNTACRPPHLGLCHAASKAALTRPRRSSSRTRAERSILKGGDVLTNAISVMLGPKGDLRKNCARK